MMFLDTAIPPQNYLEDPHAHLARWRAAAPLHHVAHQNLWLVTSYDMVARLLHDERLTLGRGSSFAERSRHFRITVVKQLRAFFAALDGVAIDDVIRDVADRAFRRILDRGEADLVSDLAQAVPYAVMGRLLGVPEAELRQLLPLSAALITDYDMLPFSGSPSRGKAVMDAYFRRHLAQARARDITPLMTLLVRAQREHGISDDMLTDVCSRLLSAGSSTTAGCLANIMVRLLRDTAAALPERPSPHQMDALIEELIRLDTPVLAIRRQAGQDFKLGDASIQKGQAIVLMVAAANRDQAYFPNPDAVDLQRTGKKQLSFGHGAFHCLGAPLTRKEIRIVLERLLPCLPAIELQAQPARRVGWLLFEPAQLPARIGVPCLAN